MTPPIKPEADRPIYIDNTPPWLRQEDLKDICSTFDEIEKGGSPDGIVDFEQAITLAGYGKFNYLLLLAILPAAWACIFDSSSMPYALPSAECDLNLTLFDKGLLNSMPFAGMIVTSFIWGFLTDTYGRKNILAWGYLMTFIVSFSSSFAHTSWLLILFKFLGGIVISGPFAALMSYLAEVHGEKERTRIYMWLGVFFSLGNISMPCLAWLILPQELNINIFDSTFNLTPWRVFLIVCSIPELAAFIALSWFPESPRFLLSKGRDDEALDVLRHIYHLNTGNDPKTFSVTRIKDEDFVKNNGKTLRECLYNGWEQMKPLFKAPHIYKLILIGSIQYCGTIGSSTIRLWMPQLFAMIETYESTHTQDTSKPSLCDMLQQTSNSNNSYKNVNDYYNDTMTIEKVCAPVVLNSTVYLNSIVIALTGVIGYTLAGSLINCAGTKKLMVFCFLTAGSCCGTLYWAEDSSGILGISSVFVALSSVGGAAVNNVIVDNFPTLLRAMAISTTMMLGRVGAVTGNVLFPVLFNLSCLGPFIMIGIACIVCSILVLFVPSKSSDLKKSIKLNGK
ncbi:synaptic vesicle glycoprotein 2B isoform X1 [Microplitis demolitor]|uniref:synaptic vesicle glycoprotein 2B isoform X1 n=1 Tax=Microplitis demolitor TaxID=69319 RepID=UPI0006D4D0A2|nr:synaptic vesicle glycoprotein 2B isoform X1 [Microplitis demolitor]